MLCKRIIPTVLVRGRTAYKGPGFGEHCTRSIGDALSICRTHARRGVDELLILDIGATPDGRGPDLDLVRDITADIHIPVTVGGGVRTVDDIDALLRAGADKIAIGAAARGFNSLMSEASERFGCQALVSVVEIPEFNLRRQSKETRIFHTDKVGEFILQSTSRESTLKGYDLDYIRDICAHVKRPVIVSGGCSGPADMLAAIQAGADACAAGALFQFTDTTPRDCAKFLKAHGVEVRL